MALSTRLRQAAQTSGFPLSRRCAALLCLAALVSMVGCGGGGGGGGSNTPPPVTTSSTVTGIVADLNRNPIVGATVTLNGKSTTTTRSGNFSFAGLAAGVYTIQASATIRGARWAGQNTVEVITDATTTPNVNILLSDITTQGTLTGKVMNAQGAALAGAKVFAAAINATDNTTFNTQGSVYAVVQADGSYSIPALPFSQYTVTASLAGYLNQTVTVTMASTAGATASFTLAKPTGNSTVPTVSDLSAVSFTSPSTPISRALSAASSSGALNAIRAYILKQRGLLGHHTPDPTRVTRRIASTATRATPAGSIIESDLFWGYNSQLNNVYGFDILRSINSTTQFGSIALVRDPLATFYADADTALTPGATVYYSIAMVDTINFPATGAEGDPLNPPVQVKPLGPIAQSAPNDGATVSGTLTFTWTAVSGATQYHVLLYNQIPDVESGTNTDPNNVPNPIWAAPSANAADPSVVNAPTTSLTYNGAALTPGTYYWVVIAYDQSGADNTISALRSFTIP